MGKLYNKIKNRLNGLKRSFNRINADFFQNWFAAGILCPMKLRFLVYRLAGNKIGKGCYLSPRMFLGYGKGKLVVGGGTFINYNCFFDLCDDIFIGNNCNIAMNVHFVNGTHEIGDKTRRASTGITAPIYVGDGSWIGADSIIMPGVKIGSGCIIGAGSLVLEDTEDNWIYIGRPAKKYKKILK